MGTDSQASEIIMTENTTCQIKLESQQNPTKIYYFPKCPNLEIQWLDYRDCFTYIAVDYVHDISHLLQYETIIMG